MGYNFLPCDRNQTYLLPPSLVDWLPQDHLVWFVLDAVEQIDLSQFYKKYRIDGVGNSAFHPSMMAALLIYSYCTGERSSRRIEKYCQTDVAYKVVTANQYPDHSTISRFRKDNQSHLKKLFLEILRFCAVAGLVKLGNVSLDGTKTKANVTDPDSRIMKTRKDYVQGLNGQAVTTEEQIIVAEDVTQEENDKQQLHPMLEQTEANREAVGIKEKTGVALADAGYCSDDNFTKTPAGDVELLVAVQKDYKQRKAMAEQPPPEPLAGAFQSKNSVPAP